MKRHIEDFFHNPLRVLVNDEGVFLIRVALVAERRIGKDSLAVCKLGVQRSLNIAARVFRESLIEQILKRNEVAQPTFRILVLGDGDVANLLLRKHELEVVVHHDVFAPES